MILTDTKIRATKPTQKAFRLTDGQGLCLVVRPNGNKHWQLRYRYLDREKTLSLGTYPRVALAEARDKKVDALRLLDAGKDPSAQRRQEKTFAKFRDRNSFGAVADEWYQKSRQSWSANHAKKVQGRLDTHVLPKLASRPIESITPLDVLGVIQDIEAKGATHMSRRCLQFCSAIFNYAIITGRARHNITLGLHAALRPHRTEHYPTLRAHELPAFLDALTKLQTTEQNKLAFRLLLLTAMRTGELRHSRWSDIDWETEEWKIPAHNTKMRTEHIVPLSRQAIPLLKRLHELTGHQDWLFPNQQHQKHPAMSENTINHMIDRMGYRGRIVGHGFRSLFSTVLNENGFNRDAIERQLAHQERNAVRAAYNRAEYMPERREIMQWWGNFVITMTK